MFRRRAARIGFVFVCLSLASTAAPAQDWTWSADANAFVGVNDQQRLFAGFESFESQNWFMLAGSRDDNVGQLTVNAMASLEPLTVGRLVWIEGGQRVDPGGSPQLFQTGESYQRIPLSNVQHPHDLIMSLGASYRIEEPTIAYTFAASVVGSPALGPTAFMHRESARDNPQAPLSHHWLDSTHVSYGVLTGGVAAGEFTIEASTFRGEEPDENRYNIERPKLDSYAARLGWRRGGWDAQVSAGHLHQPEWFEPYDETRITASLGYEGRVAARPFAAMLAWGENRDAVVTNGVSDNFLLEWDLGLPRRFTTYGRAEVVEKELLGLGYHPLGFQHPHVYSHIDALTVGTVWDLVTDARYGRFGIGGDVTVYHLSPDIVPYWDGSRSFHAFLRWRPAASGHHHH
ncbi:MAG TPA: hypothetical protein VFB07_06335 [Vicinamibacterales bacterium]|nr:hypothetical protein [Vicinamibacterales bacterium]